jgi:prepilin-type N-terminal cleavage/methylation domain-containing protein
MELFMRYKVKAFTLIELIVVMAIVSIMMAAIMKFFEPIRIIYNDATFYEQRRSVTNSMVKYTTESIRYAKYLGIYQQSDLGARMASPKLTAEQAVGGVFAGYLSTEGVTVPPNAIVNVIELSYYNDYPEGQYNYNEYYGRLYRSKLRRNPAGSGYIHQNSHLAFGASYYGANDFNMQWAYQSGKFESFASSYNKDDGVNPDGVVVRSVAAVNLKNISTSIAPGKVFFKDGATPADADGLVDFMSGPKSALSTLKTSGTDIPYGEMSASTDNSYYLVWIDADQF